MISVIMSVYNNEKTISASIMSILNQTYEDFEFLIIDDFSTDGSLEIIEEFQAIDSRIKIYKNKENLGLTKSLNFLIDKSSFNYIARQDGDDKSKKNRLKTQINYLSNKNYDFCVTRAEISKTKRKIPKFSIFFPSKLVVKYKNPFIHGSLMIKKETLLNIGSYNEKYYYAQDYKLFWDLLNQGIKFKYLYTSYYFLNMTDNISTNKKVEQKYYSDCVRKNIEPNIKI